MCRFVFYSGEPLRLSSLVTEPTHSLIRQSVNSRERSEPLNGDGFGVAWYDPEAGPEPSLFRAITPAWNNANLRDLARAVRSGCILAHVRAASPGSDVNEANCHPFRHGRWAFMHNGDVGSFADARRQMLAELSDEAFSMIRGSTDSEHVFGMLLDALGDPGRPASVEELSRAIAETTRRVVSLARARDPEAEVQLNLALTDGNVAVASRFATTPERAPSLYVNSGRRYSCCDGCCRLDPAAEHEASVIVSSEPLSEDPGWEAVPTDHLVLIRPGHPAEVRPS